MSILDSEIEILDSCESIIDDKMLQWAMDSFDWINRGWEVYTGSTQETRTKKDIFKIKEYNGKKYIDIHDSVSIKPDVTEFKYPIGVVHDIFNINNSSLKTLKNGPLEVWGYMEIQHCKNLETLEGAPEYILGNVYIIDCPKLRNMDFYPGLAHGAEIICHECPNLNNLELLKIDEINTGTCGYYYSSGSILSKYTGKRYI